MNSVRHICAQTLAFALLAVPAFAGNESNYDYLALGDSVPFGFNLSLLHLEPIPASNFTGYPEIVAQVEHWDKSKKEVNASCPGETSGSFLSPAPMTGNQCQEWRAAGWPLHTPTPARS